MSKPIIVVGSINIDLVAAAERIPAVGETLIGKSFHTYHGGKGANQAYAVAKLGYPVLMVGNVGKDVFGPQLRAGLIGAGVDTRLVNTIEGPSGVALITTGAKGENNIVVVPGANGAVTPAQLEICAGDLRQAGFILAQLEIPLDSIDWLASFAGRHDIPFMLDPAPACELPASLLRKVTWLTPNETETEILLKTAIPTGDDGAYAAAADRLLSLGVGNVLLKLGSRGCLIAQTGKSKVRVSAFPVQAVDTTAAGDAFNAGFAVGLLRDYPPALAAKFAAAVAGLSVTQHGAQPSMPSANDVDSFMALFEGVTT